MGGQLVSTPTENIESSKKVRERAVQARWVQSRRAGKPNAWWCQIKVSKSPRTAECPTSASKLTPLGESGGALELEILAAVEVAFLVEVVVN